MMWLLRSGPRSLEQSEWQISTPPARGYDASYRAGIAASDAPPLISHARSPARQASAVFFWISLGMGEWKTSSDNCETWFGKNGLPVSFVELWMEARSAATSYTKKDIYIKQLLYGWKSSCAPHSGCELSLGDPHKVLEKFNSPP